MEKNLKNVKETLNELVKVRNLNEFGDKLKKISREVMSIDVRDHLHPAAKKHLKDLEKRYHEVILAMNRAQRRFDREFHRAARNLKQTGLEIEKGLHQVRDAALKQKSKISASARKKVSKPAAAAKTTATRKKVAKKRAKKS